MIYIAVLCYELSALDFILHTFPTSFLKFPNVIVRLVLSVGLLPLLVRFLKYTAFFDSRRWRSFRLECRPLTFSAELWTATRWRYYKKPVY